MPKMVSFSYFRDKENIKTGEQSTVERFYGPPSNCNELGKIGYTLNGYYLANSANREKIEIILCQFEGPLGESKGKYYL